jgi:hypothetical protein
MNVFWFSSAIIKNENVYCARARIAGWKTTLKDFVYLRVIRAFCTEDIFIVNRLMFLNEKDGNVEKKIWTMNYTGLNERSI